METRVQGGNEPRKAIVVPGVVAVFVLTAFFGMLGMNGVERSSTRVVSAVFLLSATVLTAACAWGGVAASRRGASPLHVADAALAAWFRMFVYVLIGFVVLTVVRDLWPGARR